MTTPSTTNPPAAAADTPTPNTATLTAIRAWIKPDPRFWQFELRPWMYAVAIAAVFGCTAAVVLVVLTHSAAR